MSDNNTPSTVEQSNIHPVQITDELKTCFIKSGLEKFSKSDTVNKTKSEYNE